MPYNLLLLPLLGGYLLVSRTHLFAFKAAKQSGERLLFMAASTAVGLLFFARVIALTVVHYFPSIPSLWNQFSPWAYSGTAVLALVLGIVGASLINWLKPLDIASRLAVQQNGDGLDRLFYSATENESQVAITLASGKVYAGWLDWTPPNPGSGDAYIRVLPTMSGYRTAEQRVEWTTFYQSVYLQLGTGTAENEIESFTKVIPISQIVTAGLFDPITYNRFNRDSEEGEAPA